MPNDDFRRELNNAFDRISGPPGADLPARVRSALVDAPERRGPAWLAGVAAVAIAALVVGALFVIGPLRGHTPTIPVGVGGSPTPSASTQPSPSPSSSLPAFYCGSPVTITGNQSPQTAFIKTVRGGVNTGYDRFVVEFTNGEPASVQVTAQGSANFTKDPSGQRVHLLGSRGLFVVIKGADAHTSYVGPTDLRIGSGIIEAQQMGDFEGTVQWGLGLSGPACYRVFYLTSPDRLVIDVQT